MYPIFVLMLVRMGLIGSAYHYTAPRLGWPEGLGTSAVVGLLGTMALFELKKRRST